MSNGICEHTGNEIVSETTFNPDINSTFSAVNAARNFATEKGYTIGSMCRSEPIGLSKHHEHIAKWQNILVRDRCLCEGILISDDFRNGSVIVRIFK